MHSSLVPTPRRGLAAPLALVLALLAAPALLAQPSGAWLALDGTDGYVEIPSSPALDPVDEMTVEAWVRLDASPGCESIVGKRWTENWWLGICSGGFRTYLNGSQANGGSVPLDTWTHIAVTYDGAMRRHYVDGVETFAGAFTDPLVANGDPVRIGSDVAWEITPDGDIDEVRLWSVARSQAQIQATMNEAITTPRTGLEAVWSLDGNPQDALGLHDGVTLGSATYEGVPEPPPGPWITSPEYPDFRFKVRILPGGGIAPITGNPEPLCLPETVCVSGALAGRSEVFLRVIGPRPNGYLWPVMAKFTPSEVEVWVEQISSGMVQYYLLPTRGDELPGLFDRFGFLP